MCLYSDCYLFVNSVRLYTCIVKRTYKILFNLRVMNDFDEILNKESEQVQEGAFSRVGKTILTQYKAFTKTIFRRSSVSSQASPCRKYRRRHLLDNSNASPVNFCFITVVKELAITGLAPSYCKRPASQCLSSSFAAVDRTHSHMFMPSVR